MAQTKATRKFEQRHLKDTLQRRKDSGKVKQRHALQSKKKARRAADKGDAGEAKPQDGQRQTKSAQAAKAKKDLESMDVDEFFQNGLDLGANTKSKASQGRKRKRGDANGVQNKSAVSSDGSGADSESEGEDFEGHKKQLGDLSEKDPEFHKYLMENDPDLLDLERTDLAEFDEDAGNSEEDETPKSKKSKSDKALMNENEVTKALLRKWNDAITDQHSLRATREIVLAFRAAAHAQDEEEKTFKYSVSSPEAYHELLVLALNRVPEVLQHHLPAKETASGKIKLATESKKYATLTPLIKSYLTSLIYLLGYLSDALTLRLTLASVETLLPYALSFKKLVRDLAKTVVGIWSNSSYMDSSRIAAFLVLRKLMIIGDASIRESVLKSVYQGLVKGSRNTTVHTLPGINLMKNAAAELWGLDPSIGYTSGFGFIRQLAIHLRSSIVNRAKESYKLVYNWQYVHSLDFWSRVLSSQCDTRVEAEKGQQSPLRPLIYPVVQVTMGALRLIPTAAYFPLRFHLTRSLLRISSSTGTYIPLAASLHEVLTSGEMRRPPKGSSLKALDFSVNIRAAKSYLGTRVYQDGLGEQVQELLGEFFLLWAKSIAFPELALPVIILLKRWLKEIGPHSKHPNQNSKVSGMVSLLVQKLDANCKWIEDRRSKVDFAPKDRAGVEGFLKDTEWQKTPLGAFMAGQRKVREERAKVMEEARREEERRRQEEKAAKKGGQMDGASDDQSASEEEVEDEVEVEDEEMDDVSEESD